MKRKLLSEIKKSWWWRRRHISRASKKHGVRGIPFDYSDDQSRRIALNYELMRRAPAGKQFSQNYCELNREQRTICHKLWANLPNAVVRPISYEAQKTEKGWYSFDPNFQWNLRLNNNALLTAILEQIKLQRKIQKIRASKYLKGQINRRMSWNYVELLDLSDNKIGKLNDSQRHMVSVARANARIYCRAYKKALKQLLAGFGNDQLNHLRMAEESMSEAYNG
jgi:hypothetical protein